jgi:hypothetical protein
VKFVAHPTCDVCGWNADDRSPWRRLTEGSELQPVFPFERQKHMMLRCLALSGFGLFEDQDEASTLYPGSRALACVERNQPFSSPQSSGLRIEIAGLFKFLKDSMFSFEV